MCNIPDGVFCSCSAFRVGRFDNCHYACDVSPSPSQFSTSVSRSASCGVIRVMLRYAVLLLPLRISSSSGWLTPGCLLKMLVAKLLVCSLAKEKKALQALRGGLCLRVPEPDVVIYSINDTVVVKVCAWVELAGRELAPKAGKQVIIV